MVTLWSCLYSQVETPEDIANMFNSYFTSVSFKNESFQRTSKITINNLQTFMNTKLGPNLLKNAAHVICKPVAYLIKIAK